jgi:hypothetical protein
VATRKAALRPGKARRGRTRCRSGRTACKTAPTPCANGIAHGFDRPQAVKPAARPCAACGGYSRRQSQRRFRYRYPVRAAVAYRGRFASRRSPGHRWPRPARRHPPSGAVKPSAVASSNRDDPPTRAAGPPCRVAMLGRASAWWSFPNQFRPGHGQRVLSRGCRLVAFWHVPSVSDKTVAWQARRPGL